MTMVTGPVHAGGMRSHTRRAGSHRGPVRIGLLGPRPVPEREVRLGTARRWMVGALAVATLALFVVVLRFLSAFGVLDDLTPSGALDVAGLVLPGLLVGWCTGFAALALLLGDDLVRPRTVGLLAAFVGCVLGAALLPLGGIG